MKIPLIKMCLLLMLMTVLAVGSCMECEKVDAIEGDATLQFPTSGLISFYEIDCTTESKIQMIAQYCGPNDSCTSSSHAPNVSIQPGSLILKSVTSNKCYKAEPNPGERKCYNVTAKKQLHSNTTPERSNTTPERSNTTPERSNTTPERSNTIPERSNNTPERSNTIPERSNNTPERSNTTPERLNTTPERSNTTPERLNTTPERSNNTPERSNTNVGAVVGGVVGGGIFVVVVILCLVGYYKCKDSTSVAKKMKERDSNIEVRMGCHSLTDSFAGKPEEANSLLTTVNETQL